MAPLRVDDRSDAGADGDRGEIGSWPDLPGLAERSNVADLEALAAQPLLGALPRDMGSRGRADFLDVARAHLAPSLGGTFDAADFRRRAW